MIFTRYIRLYAYFFRFSLSRALEFRVDFWFRVFMDLFYYAVNLSFYRVIYLHTPSIAGWNEDQTLVFVGGYLLADAIYMTVFSNNAWTFSDQVNKGKLDYDLVRPVSGLFMVMFREFAANSFVNLLFAVGIFAWALMRYPDPISGTQVLAYLLLILNGAFLFGVLNFIFQMPVFWTHSGKGLHGIFYSVSRVLERPDRIFPGWWWRVFTVFLPFGLIASVPTRLFLEPLDSGLLVQTIAVSLCAYAFLIFLWKRGVRGYSSASS